MVIVFETFVDKSPESQVGLFLPLSESPLDLILILSEAKFCQLETGVIHPTLEPGLAPDVAVGVEVVHGNAPAMMVS